MIRRCPFQSWIQRIWRWGGLSVDWAFALAPFLKLGQAKHFNLYVSWMLGCQLCPRQMAVKSDDTPWSSGSLDYPLLPSGMELARVYLPLPEEMSVMNFFPCTASLLCVRQVRSQVSQSRKFAKDTDPKEFAGFACDHKDTWFNMLEDYDPRHSLGRFWIQCCSHSHWYKAVGSFLVIRQV